MQNQTKISALPGGHLRWPLLALGAVLLFNAVCTHGFFHIEVRDGRLFGSLLDILNRGAPVMLLSLGMTLVIATGGVDLSVGAVMAISGAVAAALIAPPPYSALSALDLHGSTVLVCIIALLVALCAGVWNGLLVAVLDIQPIVATLILMVAGRGVAQLLTNGQIITFKDAEFESIGGGFFLGVPFTITIVAMTAVLTGLLTRMSALGLYIEAIGNNPVASHYSGVNTRMVKTMAYAFCGLCAGMAGMIVTSDIRAADANNAGLYLELDAILAVVIGGTALTGGRFSLLGSLAGAILIQTLTTTILTRGISSQYTLVVKAAVIIAVCLLQAPKFRAMVLRLKGARA